MSSKKIVSLENRLKYTYTTGPIILPPAHEPDFSTANYLVSYILLNNDSTPQRVRVTQFDLSNPKKIALTPGDDFESFSPGPEEFTIEPLQREVRTIELHPRHEFEVVVETNSKLIFPSVLAVALGSEPKFVLILASQFIQQLV